MKLSAYKLLEKIHRIDPSKLYFSQPRVTTLEFFGDKYHTVQIADTPHYKFLQGNHKIYNQYLNASWSYLRPQKNTPEYRKKKVEKFEALLKGVQSEGIKNPILICKRPDGKMVIVEGNHRAAIALHLGIKLPYRVISLSRYLGILTENPEERYGSQLKNIPYQSIFFNGKEILKGRRQDILKRIDLIRESDIKGKVILDIGCNIGVSSFNACERGAKKVLGYDVTDNIVTSALRINSLLAQPCYFYKANFAKKVTAPQRCDVGFVFSVDQHVKNDRMLAENIKRNVKSVVYFECHSKAEMPKEIMKIFKKIKLVGYTRMGNRKFYRCEL